MTVIRDARESDVPAITTIYNEAIRTTTATFDTEEKSVEDRLAWLRSHGPRYPVIVAEVDGRVVGWASLGPWSDRLAYAGTTETSFYVQEPFRGRGFGRALKLEILRRARELGFHTVLARVADGSAASLHLNEACGLRHVGVMREVGRKFGRWLDVHLMQIVFDEAVGGLQNESPKP